MYARPGREAEASQSGVIRGTGSGRDLGSLGAVLRAVDSALGAIVVALAGSRFWQARCLMPRGRSVRLTVERSVPAPQASSSRLQPPGTSGVTRYESSAWESVGPDRSAAMVAIRTSLAPAVRGSQTTAAEHAFDADPHEVHDPKGLCLHGCRLHRACPSTRTGATDADLDPPTPFFRETQWT
jgi:hypothetical protein